MSVPQVTDLPSIMGISRCRMPRIRIRWYQFFCNGVERTAHRPRMKSMSILTRETRCRGGIRGHSCRVIVCSENAVCWRRSARKRRRALVPERRDWSTCRIQGQSSMTTPFALGTRVRVRRDPEHGPGPWPDEPTGSIIASPHDATPFSWAATTSGPELQYWVSFDVPQRDAEDDGPYTSALVLARYLERLTESRPVR